MLEYKSYLADLERTTTSRILSQENMAAHTTYAIGGPADVFVEPQTQDDLVQAVALCRSHKLPFFILGCGSDLLVADKGYRGVVISTVALDAIEVTDTHVTAQSGAALADVSEIACAASLSGFEFACGIPGSVGGACFMNAGAYDGAISDVLESVEAIDSKGNICTYTCADLAMAYRKSRVKTDNLIVCSATFNLQSGDQKEIRAKIDDLQQRRSEKQPLEMHSAGSTFKRPVGHFVGKLVSEAGLQGWGVGDAEVSQKHAGFVVNTGHATATEICQVIKHVQQVILQQNDVHLEPEVRFVGEFLPEDLKGLGNIDVVD